MSATPIADMVEAMLAKGSLPEMIVLAIRTVESASRETSRSRRVTQRDDVVREQERIRAINYRNRKRNLGGMAVHADSVTRDVERDEMRDARDDALFLTSSSLVDGQEVATKERTEISPVERAKRPKRKTALPLPDDWQPNFNHYEAAKRMNMPAGFLERKAEDMRIWAKSNDARKADWDMTFHGFLRRDSGGSNAKATRPNLSELAFDLADQARELERKAGLG